MKFDARKLKLSWILLTIGLVSCREVELTPHVPDFQLNETRVYTKITKSQTTIKFDRVEPLVYADGMYCFPKEQVVYMLEEWDREKSRSKITGNPGQLEVAPWH